MTSAAIVLAGGEGTRMQSAINKVFLEIAGKSIIERSLAIFESNPLVAEIVLVARTADVQRCRVLWQRFSKLRTVVAGGDARHRSEFAGVRALAARVDAGEVDAILVHDAVRPFVSEALIRRVLQGTADAIGCIPGLPLDGRVVSTDGGQVNGYPRNLWAVQTPQAFQATWLLEAHNKAARQGFIGTDTASVIEWAGGDVKVIEGDADNIKITSPDDLGRAEQIAAGFGG